MIYDTTYPDPQITYLINQAVGKPYSFMKRFTMGGIGSKRMDISDLSPSLENYQTKTQDTQFGFIEIRPNGILVLINKQLQNYTWPIPFTKLHLEGTKDLRITMGDDYLIFKNGYIGNEELVKRIRKFIA